MSRNEGVRSILMHYADKYDPAKEIMLYHDHGINTDFLKSDDTREVEEYLKKIPDWKREILGLE